MKSHTSQSVLLFLQIFASVLAGFFVFFSITDADIYWHLASGREIVAQRAFLSADPFSYTSRQTTWINLHWLFQVFMYLVHSAGGTTALLLVKSAIVTAAAWIIFSSFPRKRSTIALAFFFAAMIYGQRYLVPLRPTIMTLLATGIFIAALERYCHSGKLRFLLIPVFVQIAWVNSQGLYMIGPAIAAAYAAGEYANRKASAWFPGRFLYNPLAGKLHFAMLALLPVLLLAASLINPYGTEAITFSINLFRRITPSASNIYSGMITENMPLFSMPGTIYSHYPAIILGMLLLLVFTTVAAIRHVRFAHLGLAAMGLFLAVMAQRNGIIFTFFTIPAILHNVSVAALPRKRLFLFVKLLIAIAIASGTVYAVIRHAAFLHTWPHTVSPFSFPVNTAGYIRNHPFSGNIFNADRYGGYLTWKLYPSCKVSHDTRWTLRTDNNFKAYMQIIADPSGFDDYARKHEITRVALPVAPLQLYIPLAKYLYRHPEWKMVYTDGAETFFAKNSSDSVSPSINLNSIETIKGIINVLQTRFSSSPSVKEEALTGLAQWCTITESFSGAEHALSQCTGPSASIILASVYSLQGFYYKAETVLTSEVAKYQNDKFLRMCLIQFYINNGHADKAISHLSLILKKDPFYKPARKLLFMLSQQPKDKS